MPITESENGFIQIKLDNIQEGTIEIHYEGTNIMKLSMAITIMSFTIFILYFCKKEKE